MGGVSELPIGLRIFIQRFIQSCHSEFDIHNGLFVDNDFDGFFDEFLNFEMKRNLVFTWQKNSIAPSISETEDSQAPILPIQDHGLRTCSELACLPQRYAICLWVDT